MPEHMPELPRVYIYFDEGGVESLYAQIVDRVEVEVAKSRGASRGVKAGAGLGLGVLLGLPSVDLAAETTVERRQIEETKSRLAPEHKLNALIRYLELHSKGAYFVQLANAAIAANQSQGGVYVMVSEKFNLPQFYAGSGVDDVNRDQYVDFEIGPLRPNYIPSYDFATQHFRQTHYHFFMSAALSHFRRVRDGIMRPSSHDAAAFKSHKGFGVPVTVFGYLNHLIEYEYQLKPFAIW